MLPPLTFHPILKPRPWGSNRLTRLGKLVPEGTRIGESWELADLPDAIPGGQSTVAGGRFEGVSLRNLRLAQRDELLGITTPAPDGAFPLLIKFLDAAENLSVQVHPDARYAQTHVGAHLKNEAWVVLDAEPGARLYRGFRPDVTRADFDAALAAGTVVELLHAIEVQRGDCVYLPSGLCHALGAGIVVAEIQTPSDTTFRVWDWNRSDPARPLHLDQARACLRFGGAQSDGVPPLTRAVSAPTTTAGGVVTKRLLRTPFFGVDWIECAADTVIPIEPTGVAEIWMTIQGAATWHGLGGDGGGLKAPTGSTILRPAAVAPGEVRVDAGSAILRIICASALDRAVARG
jgi:mannose-6-phosphate isomerase